MTEIRISDVDSESSERARSELEQLFGVFENLMIIITKDFDNKVIEYLQMRGVTEEYQSTRAGGEVVACKVLHYPLNNHLGSCLVINGNARMFSYWNGDSWVKLERIHCLTHEREHILRDQERYRLVGYDKFFSTPSSTVEWMYEFAHDVMGEYIAERGATQAMQRASNVDLSHYFSQKLKGLIEVLTTHLESFQAFVAETINSFRTSRITTDDFWGSVYLRTRDILNALTLSSALTHTIPAISPTLLPVVSDRTFKEIFQEVWNRVEQILESAYENQSDYEEYLVEMSVSFRHLFETLGFEMRDLHGKMAIYLRS